MRSYPIPSVPAGNLWAGLKAFAGGGYKGAPFTKGKVWYVNANSETDSDERAGPVGSDGNNGLSPLTPFATVSRAFEFVDSYDVIVLDGVIREQVVAPLGVFDVTLIGGANRPRQATDGGVPTNGGATWLAPTSPTATTPLLELREQGWTLCNIFFSGHTDDAAVKLHCEETATYPDASHASFVGCRFVGGLIQIEDYGGASNVLIEDCSFEDSVGAGGGAIVVTNQSIRIPQRWLVRNNKFLPGVNGMVGAWVDSVIRDNTIAKATTATLNLASGNTGLRNFIVFNYFNIAAADFDPAGGVTGNATDTWINYLSDVLEFGVPAN